MNAGQTGRMRRKICVFVVRMKQYHFLRDKAHIYENHWLFCGSGWPTERSVAFMNAFEWILITTWVPFLRRPRTCSILGIDIYAVRPLCHLWFLMTVKHGVLKKDGRWHGPNNGWRSGSKWRQLKTKQEHWKSSAFKWKFEFYWEMFQLDSAEEKTT